MLGAFSGVSVQRLCDMWLKDVSFLSIALTDMVRRKFLHPCIGLLRKLLLCFRANFGTQRLKHGRACKNNRQVHEHDFVFQEFRSHGRTVVAEQEIVPSLFRSIGIKMRRFMVVYLGRKLAACSVAGRISGFCTPLNQSRVKSMFLRLICLREHQWHDVSWALLGGTSVL